MKDFAVYYSSEWFCDIYTPGVSILCQILEQSQMLK